MDFEFHVRGLGGESHISKWDAQALRKLSGEELEHMRNMLLQFGKRSATAQGLGSPITDLPRLQSTDQRLYLFAVRRSGGTSLLGGIKVGVKKLFVRTDTTALVELEPLCVLDFYVHESCQRQGVGKQLFEHVLAAEQVHPAGLAYDRPSPKFLAFLHKYYGLSDFIPQNNNYVLFKQYYELYPLAPAQRGRLPGVGVRPSPRRSPVPVPSPSPPPPPPQPSSSPSFQPPPYAHSPRASQQQQQQQQYAPPAAPYLQQDQNQRYSPNQRQYGQQQAEPQYSGGSSNPNPPSSHGSPPPGYDGAPGGYSRSGPQGPGGSPPPGYGGPGPSGYGSGSPGYSSNPPPGYVGTGMRTKVVMQAPQQQQQPSGYAAGGSPGQQLPPRSLQPSQSFGQRWGQSNGLAGAPGPAGGPSRPYSGVAPVPSGSPSGFGAGPGTDSLDSFRMQQQQQQQQSGGLPLPSMQQPQAGGGGRQHRAPGQHSPTPPWATDGSSGPGLGPGPRQSSWSPGGAGSGAMGSLVGRPSSGSWQAQGSPGPSGWQAPGGGQGQGPPGGPGAQPSPSARSAGLAQRAGSGAAGCLVW